MFPFNFCRVLSRSLDYITSIYPAVCESSAVHFFSHLRFPRVQLMFIARHARPVRHDPEHLASRGSAFERLFLFRHDEEARRGHSRTFRAPIPLPPSARRSSPSLSVFARNLRVFIADKAELSRVNYTECLLITAPLPSKDLSGGSVQ